MTEDVSCHTAIIGGGIVGLALAYNLSKRQKVVLLEGQEVGSGSSGWNAGILSLSTTLDLAVLGKMVGEEKAKLLASALATTLDTTRKALNLNGDVWQVGRSLFASVKKPHHKLLTDEHGVQEKYGFHSALIGKAELSAFWKRFSSALALSHEHAVHPYRLLLSLAAEAEKQGLVLFEHSPATNWEADKEGVTISVNGHTVKAKNLVVATGVTGLEKHFDRRIKRRTIAVTGQIVVTEPSEQVKELIAKTGTIAMWDTLKFYHYVHYLADGRILIGSGDSAGRTRNTDVPHDHKSVKELWNWCQKHHAFALPPVQCAWRASLIYPLDGMPLIAARKVGRTRIIHAVTDGLPFGLLIGKALADDLCGDKSGNSRAVLDVIGERHNPGGAEALLAMLPENATVRNLAVRVGMLGLKLQDLFL